MPVAAACLLQQWPRARAVLFAVEAWRSPADCGPLRSNASKEAKNMDERTPAEVAAVNEKDNISKLLC